MEFVVYILYSKKFNKTYVGFTSNLIGRIKSHNELGNDWTKSFRPWKVAYIEVFENKTDAIKKEKYFKTGRGRIEKDRIIQQFLIA
jgi:putative endonuclease